MSYEFENTSRANTGRNLIYDGAVINDEIKTIFGDRIFLATDLKSGTFQGSDKLEPCQTMTITGMVKDGIERVPVSIKLFLHRDYEWKIASLCRCLGLKKRGVPYKVDFSEFLGRQGKVHIRPKSYIDRDGIEHTYNEVDKFYDYDPAFFEDNEAM